MPTISRSASPVRHPDADELTAVPEYMLCDFGSRFLTYADDDVFVGQRAVELLRGSNATGSTVRWVEADPVAMATQHGDDARRLNAIDDATSGGFSPAADYLFAAFSSVLDGIESLASGAVARSLFASILAGRQRESATSGLQMETPVQVVQADPVTGRAVGRIVKRETADSSIGLGPDDSGAGWDSNAGVV